MLHSDGSATEEGKRTSHRTPKVLAIQHVATEPLGLIGDAMEKAGIQYDYVRPFLDEAIPRKMGDADGLIVMGGPMGVYESSRYPFLLDEVRLIEAALLQMKPVLGICLGSQLLATALGVEVGKASSKEIGWYDVTLNDNARIDSLMAGVRSPFVAYHWHGDVFRVPAQAVALASSEKTECQAFRFGANAYGLLFHTEATTQIVTDMIEAFAAELDEEQIDRQTILDGTQVHLSDLQAIGAGVFEKWAHMVRVRNEKSRA